MGNCTDTCVNKKEQVEAEKPQKKKEAAYMVGTNKNGFDVCFA